MQKRAHEKGFVRGALLLLILVVIALALYWMMPRTDVDMEGAGKSVAVEIDRAAEAVRDTSEDAFLTAKVKTAIALSKSASTFDIDVDSDDGVVTLTGTLPSREGKDAVLQIARETDGVASVVDQIQIDAASARVIGDDEAELRLRDLQIETAVYERLLASDGLDARRVRISVEGGVVRLSGSVPDGSQKVRVEEVVASVAGVSGVRNELDVLAPAAAYERTP